MIEELIAEFGEQYRTVITDAIKWLEENEGYWNLKKPLDRREYIQNILEKGHLPSGNGM